MGLFDRLIGKINPELDGGEEEKYENGYDEYEEDSSDISEAINSAARKAVPKSGRPSGGISPQFVLVKPERFDDAILIADHIIGRKTVVLNLEGTGKDLSRRIIDILSGTAYAVGAQIKNVSVGTFLIIPGGAQFSGENLDDIESGSFIL